MKFLRIIEELDSQRDASDVMEDGGGTGQQAPPTP